MDFFLLKYLQKNEWGIFMQENQKKNEQGDMGAGRKRTLAGIILLLILGFAVNYFFGDAGKEAGSDAYQPEISATPGITDGAGVTGEPEATDKPEVTEVPEATDEPEVTGVPEATKEPEATGVPAATDEPETTGIPAATDEPEATEAPKVTDEPGITATPEPTIAPSQAAQPGQDDGNEVEILYKFRKNSYLEQHFEKHGGEFDYTTKEEYLAGANRVIQSPDALHKIEAEDGDDIYYLEETNEFVVVSTDGYIRTYFRPSAGIDYYNRQ